MREIKAIIGCPSRRDMTWRSSSKWQARCQRDAPDIQHRGAWRLQGGGAKHVDRYDADLRSRRRGRVAPRWRRAAGASPAMLPNPVGTTGEKFPPHTARVR